MGSARAAIVPTLSHGTDGDARCGGRCIINILRRFANDLPHTAIAEDDADAGFDTSTLQPGIRGRTHNSKREHPVSEVKRGLLAVALAFLLAAVLSACQQPQAPGDGGGERDGARWNEAIWNDDVWN
jgi:hypothetical protein